MIVHKGKKPSDAKTGSIATKSLFKACKFLAIISSILEKAFRIEFAGIVFEFVKGCLVVFWKGKKSSSYQRLYCLQRLLTD